MNKNRERKSNLITIRLSDVDMETVEYLSDRTNKSKSDTILRACKFGLYAGDIFNNESENEQWGKVRKQKLIHLRMTDSDKNLFETHGRELGKTISQIVRASIRAYNRSLEG